MKLYKLGRYELVGILGSGAMGCVFEAIDPNLNRRVAIKTIKIENLSAADANNYEVRFRTEAHSAARLQHPNVVSLYDSGRDDGVAFLVMEFVDGKDLKYHLDTGTLYSLEQTLEIMTALLSALEYAHRNQIVHRDVKPANLLLTLSGQIKLTDFGVARMQDADDITKTQGTVVGTLKYMSPEQIQGLPVDARADIFAAGVILYQLLAGFRPFEAETDFGVIQNIVSKRHETVTSINPKLPFSIDAVIARALAKKREDRYPSASEFASDLKKACSDALKLGITPPCIKYSEVKRMPTVETAPLLNNKLAKIPLNFNSDFTVEQEIELVYWNNIKYSSNTNELHAFIARFPVGIYAALALRRLNRLTAQPSGSSSTSYMKENERWTSSNNTNSQMELKSIDIEATAIGASQVNNRPILSNSSISFSPIANLFAIRTNDIETPPSTHKAEFGEPLNTNSAFFTQRLAPVVALITVATLFFAIFFRYQTNSVVTTTPTGSQATVNQPTDVRGAKTGSENSSAMSKIGASNENRGGTTITVPKPALKNSPVSDTSSSTTNTKASSPKEWFGGLIGSMSRSASTEQMTGIISSNPEQLCEGRLSLSFENCMVDQCAKSNFYSLAICTDRRKLDQQRREQDQYR